MTNQLVVTFRLWMQICFLMAGLLEESIKTGPCIKQKKRLIRPRDFFRYKFLRCCILMNTTIGVDSGFVTSLA